MGAGSGVEVVDSIAREDVALSDSVPGRWIEDEDGSGCTITVSVVVAISVSNVLGISDSEMLMVI